LAEVAKAKDDSEVASVLAKRSDPETEKLLSVAATTAPSWKPGSALPEAALEQVDLVLPPSAEGTRPFRVESAQPPEKYRAWLYNEQKVNDKINKLSDCAPRTHNDVPKELVPKAGNVFRVAPVEVPFEEAQLVTARG